MNKSSESVVTSANQNYSGEPQDIAWQIAAAAEDKKAQDIVILKVSEVSYLADYFVIVSGFSRTQLNAIAESVEEQLEGNLGLCPVRVSGKKDGDWIVLDYGDVIAHIFLPEEREYYNLEAFWGHAERLEYSPPS